MAEVLRIARGSIDLATAASLAAVGGYTIEWFEEIVRDGEVIQQQVFDDMHQTVMQQLEQTSPETYDGEYTSSFSNNYLDDSSDLSNSQGSDITSSIDYDTLSIALENFSSPPKRKRRTKAEMKAARELLDKSSDKIEKENTTHSFYRECLSKSNIKSLGLKLNKESINSWTAIVFGCGGTGGRLIDLLSQTVMAEKKLKPRNYYNLIVVDNDIVEAKNLSRQNFYEFELGMNKAEAIATRYSLLYGINIDFISSRIDDTNIHENFIYKLDRCLSQNHSNLNPIVIFDCTDNVDARKSIVTFTYEMKRNFNFNLFLISCGNEFDFGQVNVSNDFYGPKNNNRYNMFDLRHYFNTAREINLFWKALNFLNFNENNTEQNFIPCLPGLFNLYKEFKDTETSCAEIASIREQSMPINSLVANIAFSNFSQIINGSPVKNILTTCNTSSTEFSTWNISIPDNYIKIIVRSIYGNKLMPDEIEDAKEFLAQTSSLFFKNASGNEIHKDYKISSNNESFIDYMSLLSYLVLIDRNNNQSKSLYQILKDQLAIYDNWIYYPLVLNLYFLYNHIKRVDSSSIVTRNDILSGKISWRSQYSWESISHSFPSDRNILNSLWDINKSAQNPDPYYIKSYFALVTNEENDEIVLLFNTYFNSIKHKVQVNNAII